MQDRNQKPKYRGVAGARRTGYQSRSVRSRDSVGALAPGRTRQSPTQRQIERRRMARRGRLHRPMTFSEILLWGAGAAVIGAFLSLLYFQNWLLAAGALVLLGLAFYWMRR